MLGSESVRHAEDGVVDSSDLALVNVSWGDSVPPAPMAAVPEPGTLLLLAIGGLCLLPRTHSGGTSKLSQPGRGSRMTIPLRRTGRVSVRIVSATSAAFSPPATRGRISARIRPTAFLLVVGGLGRALPASVSRSFGSVTGHGILCHYPRVSGAQLPS